ncbi:Protein of unknown function [Dyella sp. OK004]|uniref:DUF2894 domain-containing protein n=1 Tax=Dyella sp. OK004 TaxID=1855292 RepID=UPI0008E712D4|nr:DUF2894 domain-containing protein [Dyella sp. OK004]SFS15196.1 Protein of unknown function [Dyella sp. OK004]
MSASARAILDVWREQRADRLNPIRFHFIDALERRAASHDGEARRLLDDRLSQLIEAYADDLKKAAFKVDNADSTAILSAPARGALGDLVDDIAGRAAVRDGDLAADDATPQPALFPQLHALDDFKKIWSKVRTESQLRESLEQVPTNAGPLNSGNLVHRSLTLMRELSPGYLQQFLSYVDALLWVEQMSGGGVLVTKDAPRVASARKRARGNSRERRD